MSLRQTESVTTRSRPFANKFSYARDMCHGTSLHPAAVKAVFESGNSHQADGLTKVLAGASMKRLCRTLVWHLSLADVLLCLFQATILVEELVSRTIPQID